MCASCISLARSALADSSAALLSLPGNLGKLGTLMLGTDTLLRAVDILPAAELKEERKSLVTLVDRPLTNWVKLDLRFSPAEGLSPAMGLPFADIVILVKNLLDPLFT